MVHVGLSVHRTQGSPKQWGPGKGTSLLSTLELYCQCGSALLQMTGVQVSASVPRLHLLSWFLLPHNFHTVTSPVPVCIMTFQLQPISTHCNLKLLIWIIERDYPTGFICTRTHLIYSPHHALLTAVSEVPFWLNQLDCGWREKGFLVFIGLFL